MGGVPVFDSDVKGPSSRCRDAGTKKKPSPAGDGEGWMMPVFRSCDVLIYDLSLLCRQEVGGEVLRMTQS